MTVEAHAATARRAERTGVELADVFRAHGDQLGPLGGQKNKAVRAIISCRTASLGGHVQECDRCGHREISYNSCRNRHCPKCQTLEAARWVEAQKENLLPVPYFHVVFTVPSELHRLFLANPRVAYDLLFAAAAETLQEVALNPRHLGAQIGFLAVLHTWTQKLLYHPHLHCVVPGGGVDPTGSRWLPCKPGFFLPVKILSEVFRGKLLSRFERALAERRMQCEDDDAIDLLRKSSRHNWVVYSKPPFAGPEAVVQYLSRYTHRIAISNQRLISLESGRVTFAWKDRGDENKRKYITLDAKAFLERFLLHILPMGLVRIRYYGFLANSVRGKKVALCRDLLLVPPPGISLKRAAVESWQAVLLRLTGIDATRCPECEAGSMVTVEKYGRRPLMPRSVPAKGRSP